MTDARRPARPVDARPRWRVGAGPQRRWLLAAALLAPWLAPGRAQTGTPPEAGQAPPLRVVLAPYLSPSALLTVFRPLREHLSARLGQPVELFTARDFVALARAVRAGAYDIALLPAHLGWLAITDWGWQPLARTLGQTEVLVLVRDGGPVRAPSDLRGRRVGALAPLALSSMTAQRWLRAQGLDGPGGAVFESLPSINSALFALDRGEVGAIVATASQLRGLPTQTPRGERVLRRLGPIPGPVLVAHPDVPAPTLARWRDAVLARTPDPSRPLTAANSQPLPLSLDDLAVLAPLGGLARERLARER